MMFIVGLMMASAAVLYFLGLAFVAPRPTEPGPDLIRGAAGFLLGLVLAFGLASMVWSLWLRRISPLVIVLIALVPALVLLLNLAPGGDGFGDS